MACDRKIGPYPCCSVVEGDCLELMKALPDGCVDAVITDPPYGVAKAEWDDMDACEFARLCMSWMTHAVRIAPELVTFGTDDSAIRDLTKMVFPRVRTMIWEKPFGTHYAGASERGMFYAFESIFHGYTPTSHVQPKDLLVGECIKAAREKAGLSRGAIDMVLRGKKTGLCFRWEEGACLPSPQQVAKLKEVLPLNGDLDAALLAAYAAKEETMAGMAEDAAQLRDVFSYRGLNLGIHPCQKPEELMADIVSIATKSGGTIIDPFAGSGSTLVAAKKLGRHYLGFEISHEYCEIARERLARIDAQPSLFTPKPEQLTFNP